MKTCREVHEEATELLEGQLALLSRLKVRMHLLLCVHCRRYVRHLRLLARRHSHLGGVSPDQFEAAHKPQRLGVH